MGWGAVGRRASPGAGPRGSPPGPPQKQPSGTTDGKVDPPRKEPSLTVDDEVDPPRKEPSLTIDGEVDPAAVVEGVILLVQHEHFALVPALVLRANLFQPQRCLIMKTGPAWGNRADKKPHRPSGKASSSPPSALAKDRGPLTIFIAFPMAGPQNNSWTHLQQQVANERA